MADRHFQSPENPQPPTTTSAWSPETALEVQRDLTATMLYWMAKALHMEPQRLEQSPALQEMLRPYFQWLSNAPPWMQFTSLLAAKKCQQWSGIVHDEGRWPPFYTELTTETAPHDCHWMPSSAAPEREYIDVDAEDTRMEEAPTPVVVSVKEEETNDTPTTLPQETTEPIPEEQAAAAVSDDNHAGESAVLRDGGVVARLKKPLKVRIPPPMPKAKKNTTATETSKPVAKKAAPKTTTEPKAKRAKKDSALTPPPLTTESVVSPTV